MTSIDRPSTSVDMRWRVPKTWNSYGILYKRQTGQFIRLDTEAQDAWLRRRLEVTAEACRQIIDAWEPEKKSTTEARRRIADGARAYLASVGLTENELYWKSVWPTCERIINRCQTYIQKRYDFNELKGPLKSRYPSAFAMRLYCGRMIDDTPDHPLKHDGGNRWEIEPNLWVTAAGPLCHTLDVDYGEIALVNDRWMARFILREWAKTP